MKPKIGTFYILDGHLYISTFNQEGLDHNQLWKVIVSQVFKSLDFETKKELINAPYGTDRGRVVWNGKIDERGRHVGEGSYVLYGTPGCAQHVATLKRNFGLGSVPNLKVDFESDPHYKVDPRHKDILVHVMKLLGNKLELKDTVIARNKGKIIEKVKTILLANGVENTSAILSEIKSKKLTDEFIKRYKEFEKGFWGPPSAWKVQMNKLLSEVLKRDVALPNNVLNAIVNKLV